MAELHSHAIGGGKTDVIYARKNANEGLNHFGIRADFAEAVVYSYQGGTNELEIGGVLTSPDAALSLKSKIDAALDSNSRIDLSLWLTDLEAMCLALAAENCQLEGLPAAQRKKIEKWKERWLASPLSSLEAGNG